MMKPTPVDLRSAVGIGLILIRDGQVLLGRRRNSHGAGTWCGPGGHQEFNERFIDCARREVRAVQPAAG